MKFAFIIMGNFNPAADNAEIHGGLSRIVGVSREALNKSARADSEEFFADAKFGK